MSFKFKPFLFFSISILQSNMFVGWKKEREDLQEPQADYVRIVFRFDGVFNFTSLQILLASKLGSESTLPRLIEVRLSRQFPRASSADPATTLAVSVDPLVATIPQDPASSMHWINVDIVKQIGRNSSLAEYDSVARFVELRIYYASSWIAVGEVKFQNGKPSLC